MDGQFYHDTKPPHISADMAQITLLTTLKAITPPAAIPMLGNNYFGYVGKAVRIRVFGRQFTGATPGNITMAFIYGSGADNVGITLVNPAAIGTANQTNVSFLLDVIVRCRALGVSGSLLVTGAWFIATQGFFLFPPSAPAPVTCDLTQNPAYVTVQAARSGSTAETMTVHDIQYESLN